MHSIKSSKPSVGVFEIPYKGYWSKKSNQRIFFDWLATELKLKSLDDWKNVTTEDVIQHGGRTVLKNYYDNSLCKALQNLYPEHEWKLWSQTRIKKDYWTSFENQRKLFDSLINDMRLNSPKDLAHLTLSSLEKVSSRGHYVICKFYKFSVENALRNIYPEVDWASTQFGAPYKPRKQMYSRAYWTNVQNQKDFLDKIKTELNIQNSSEWTKVGYRDIIERGGTTLIKMYEFDVGKLVDTVYGLSTPRWMFKRVTKEFWDDIQHQREYFDWMAKQLQINTFEDWYKIKLSDVKSKFRCAFLLEFYGDSLCKALQAVYPEFNWQPWRFTSAPRGFWLDESNLRQYLDWLGEQLGITTLDDWYNIPLSQVTTIAHVFGHYGGFIPMLAKLYPHHNWNFQGMAKQLQQQGGFGVVGKSQAHLTKIVGMMFPTEAIQVNYKHEQIHFENTNRPIELDLFLPRLRLAFEYQGEQHYGHHYLFGDSTEVQQRDREKKAACDAWGITLIAVPYWWDRTRASLQATIHKYRPDLVSSSERPPIAENAPRSARAGRRASLRVTPYPYYITVGRTGNATKCRGCGNWLRDKNAPRVAAHGSYSPLGKNPLPTRFVTCLHVDEKEPLKCLHQAVDKYEHGREGICFPPFQSVIGVTEKIKSVLPVGLLESLSDQGIQFPDMKE